MKNMMTQLIDDFVNRLSQTTPCFYHNISPLLAVYVHSNYSVINSNGFELGTIDTIHYAASQSQAMYEHTIDGLVECTKQNIAQMITLAYSKMQQYSHVANESDWYVKLKETINNARQPGFPIIIASYGVDLHTLSMHCKSLRQENGSWYLNNDKVYEMTLLNTSPRLDSSFIVLSKNDAPFFDFGCLFERPNTIPHNGIITNDVYQSLCIYVAPNATNNLNYLKVMPRIPLLFHPDANIHTLNVNINPDNV